MTSGGQSIVIGIFDDPSSADRAMMALQQAGYSNEQIHHTTSQPSERGIKGIKALFTGEKAAPSKDITRDLENLGVDHEDARIYQREYEAGHPLVSVEGKGNMQDAVSILSAQGARSPSGLTNKEASYRTTGMPSKDTGTRAGEASLAEDTGTRAGEAPLAEDTGIRAGEAPLAEGAEARAGETPLAETGEGQKMRLHAEQLRAYKQPEQVGEVNVRKEVVSEQQTLNVPVTREEVVVERRSLAGDASAAEAEEPIGEGETLRIPVSEEKVNVTKEAMATGEVDISKRRVQESRQFTDTVRHEEAHIEKEGDIPITDTGINQPPPDQPQV